MMFAFFVGKGSESEIVVPVFNGIADSEFTPLLEELNESSLFKFESMDEKALKAAVEDGKLKRAYVFLRMNFL
jgi:hypothetical protein